MRRKPVYWLHADRYRGDMTLTQALKGNLGDPAGQTSGRRTIRKHSLQTAMG